MRAHPHTRTCLAARSRHTNTVANATAAAPGVCGTLLEQYSIVPGISYGLAHNVSDARRQWVLLGCNARICEYLAATYGVVPGGTGASKWGSLPAVLNASWTFMRVPSAGARGGSCDQIMRGCTRRVRAPRDRALAG